MAAAAVCPFFVRLDGEGPFWGSGSPKFGWLDWPANNLYKQRVRVDSTGQPYVSDIRRLGEAPSFLYITSDRITSDHI